MQFWRKSDSLAGAFLKPANFRRVYLLYFEYGIGAWRGSNICQAEEGLSLLRLQETWPLLSVRRQDLHTGPGVMEPDRDMGKGETHSPIEILSLNRPVLSPSRRLGASKALENWIPAFTEMTIEDGVGILR